MIVGTPYSTPLSPRLPRVKGNSGIQNGGLPVLIIDA